MARRLIEQGVAFVEVSLGAFAAGSPGWDTHANNFPNVRRLCEAIDRPWATLMDELQTSGLLDETVVLWMGEFGRTPRINANSGRDHFPRVTPAVIAGGGLVAGTVVGKTNRLGTQIEGDSNSVADLFATVFGAMGIEPEHEFTTSFGSPAAATDGGTVIRELS